MARDVNTLISKCENAITQEEKTISAAKEKIRKLRKEIKKLKAEKNNQFANDLLAAIMKDGDISDEKRKEILAILKQKILTVRMKKIHSPKKKTLTIMIHKMHSVSVAIFKKQNHKFVFRGIRGFTLTSERVHQSGARVLCLPLCDLLRKSHSAKMITLILTINSA